MDEQTRIEVEAAAFRDLLAHLRRRSDVQNIDLMNLAGFCRNCLAKWYRSEAERHGETIDYETAREYVYGMPYPAWRQRFQVEANAEQKATFESTRSGHADTSGGH